MKQILQNLSNGKTELVEAPSPNLRAGHVLVDTSVSLISIGTERMLVDFGRSGFISKARQQPEKVRQVIDKVQTDGLLTTIDAVRSKLLQPIPLGYCNVGLVRESRAHDLAPGDRVVSNGHHSDVVCVPRNLTAKIPDHVSDETASFTVVASIGLQGIRLANATLGECFAVMGVGLIGLLTVQMLRAQGCRVLAIDFDAEKLELAREYGADICNLGEGADPVSVGMAFSRGFGVDGVIITASTKSNDPIHQAASMCRKRGRIVLVGVVGLKLNRADFYDKELSFQVSCSYGPGRYDPAYEEQGHDYPIGFVRWTEQRNFEAVLDLMATGALDTSKLLSRRFEFTHATDAYDFLATDKSALGILLEYSHPIVPRYNKSVMLSERAVAVSDTTVGFIGAGNYASRNLIPAFKAGGAKLHSIASSGGISAAVYGRKTGFAYASSDTEGIIRDPDIPNIVIATRHNSHAALVCEALEANKNVFVEKPLALTLEELASVEAAYARSNKLLMVGFNRRFAPHIQIAKRALNGVREPKSFLMLMNAGSIPTDHWVHDPIVGGGRIIGEACHYIDLMRYLADSPIVSVQARRMGGDELAVKEDKAVIILGFADGSFGTIHYLANGGSSFPKERIEIFAAQRTLQIDNFTKLRSFNWNGIRNQRLWRQDKGQAACAKAFLEAVANGQQSPIPAQQLFEVTRVTIEAVGQLAAQC